MIENGKSASQRMNKGNFAGPRGLVETCARGKAIANNKAWRTGAMTRTRNNFGIGYLNLAFKGLAFFFLSLQGQVPVSRETGKVRSSTHMDGFRVYQELGSKSGR